MSLSSFIVRSENGMIDQASTVASFEAKLSAYAEELETEGTVLRTAVHETFTERGNRLPMPAAVALATARLNPQSENYGSLETKVKLHIRENSNNSGTREYRIGKGPQGGVSLVSLLSDEERASHQKDCERWAAKADDKSSK